MFFTEQDELMLQASINIFSDMFYRLRKIKPSHAMKTLKDLDEETRKKYQRKDKKDTTLFDIIAEKSIGLGSDSFRGHHTFFEEAYGRPGLIITEECGKVGSHKIEPNTPVIISDPVDGSSKLEEIAKKYSRRCKTMGDAFDREREFLGDRANLDACNSSVTLLKDNTIKYSIIMNLLTGKTYLASPQGVFSRNIRFIKSKKDFNKRVEFLSQDNSQTLFYNNGSKYDSNRLGTHLRFFPFVSEVVNPIGPMRFAYLIKEKKYNSGVGIIAHNGEKIQEILPNIAVAFFSRGELTAYKLFCNQEYLEHRAGKILTPNIQNSLWDYGLIRSMGIKLTLLNNHEYPSEFRDTTIVCSSKNDWTQTMMAGMVQK